MGLKKLARAQVRAAKREHKRLAAEASRRAKALDAELRELKRKAKS